MSICFRKLATLAICCLLLTIAAGCDGQLPRMPVSGTITLDGKPLDDVTLIFTPKGEGLAAAADVVDGKFNCSDREGPQPGDYDVVVSPNEAELEAFEAGEAPPAERSRKPRVPRKYQQRGELTASITDQPDQQIVFELRSR